MIEYLSDSETQTQALGQTLAALLKPGDVLALDGDLGTGKTTLTRGICTGLGGDPDQVRSPTYVLMHEYATQPPLVHMDAYRLDGASEALMLDLEQIFDPSKITLIEWAQRCKAILPENHYAIQLDYVAQNQRRIHLPRIAGLQQALGAL